MIEAKMKEQAIFKLYEKYPQLNCKINIKEDLSQYLCVCIDDFENECECCKPNKFQLKIKVKKKNKKLL